MVHSVFSSLARSDNLSFIRFFFFYSLALLLLFTPLEFFTSVLADGFSQEVEWQQVSTTRLRILAVLSNAVVWIVSTRPPTSKSSRSFNNPLVIVPNAPITIRTIVTFMFNGFFQFSSKVEVLILLFTFLQIYSVVRRDSKVDSFACSLFFFFFFFCWLLWGLVFWPGLVDPFVCLSPIGVYACHFQGQVVGSAYTIFLYGRIEISCSFLSGSPCRPCRVSPYTPSVLIYCIRLLCDWSFRLCHRIAYIYYYYYYYYYWLFKALQLCTNYLFMMGILD